MNIIVRELKLEDKEQFLFAMQRSQSLHHPWMKAPLTSQEFDDFFQRHQQPNQKSLIALTSDHMIGVFNITEIVRGVFQNAFLGFCAAAEFSGKGYMSASLKIVLKQVFEEMQLHRLEANIQPENIRSIQLVKKNGFRYEGFSPRYLKINGAWRGCEHWAITVEDYRRDDPEILKKDHVDLVTYNPKWPQEAKLEMDKIRSMLPANKIIDIQHVGSTAIPGISAKPIIDIQIAVKSLDEMKVIAVPNLQKLGYEYWDENPDPERMFFVKGMPPYGEKRTHHVHIFELASKHWQQKIIFRDYLLSHPDAAKEYQQLKFKLAQQHSLDREKYTEAKSEFVHKILKLTHGND